MYCLKTKHIPILELVSIASGFLLRAFGGALNAGLELSQWFVLCVGLLSIFLAIEKRKAELIRSQETNLYTREVIKSYSRELLLRLESTVTTSAFICYSLWASSPPMNSWMIITSPLVLRNIQISIYK